MDVFDLSAKITLNSSEYTKGLADASSQTSSIGGKIASGLGTAAKVGGAALAAASGAMLAFGKSAVDAGMNFDSSMSQVAATMGYSLDDIANNVNGAADTMNTLRDFAQEMGSTTAFSASEAADALNYMALAGYDAEKSMDMLPKVLNLAAAGGMDLARASDMVTDASSALGLDTEQTAEMIDKMAVAASKSNTSVEQLGDAILTVGGTAKMMSGGTTELSAALGILADNGTKGAEGGTKLRNILLSLGAPTDKAAAMMETLGVSAYDADGNMRPLQDTFADLNSAMSEMTDAEKTDVINTIFNKADLKDVNALLATSADRWDELSAAIDDSTGAAADMAAVQLDNLEGDVTLFKSALEGAQIAVSDALTPALRDFVQFGSEGLSTLTSAFKEGGLSGAMDALGGILSDGLAMIIDMLPKVIDAGMKLLKALIQGIVQNLPQIIDAGMQILEMLANAIIENLPTLLEAALQIILQIAMGIAHALPELIPTIVDVVLTMVETLIDNVDLLIDASIALIVGLAEGLINALPKLIEKGPEIVLKLADAIVNNAPKLLQTALQLIVTLANALITYMPKLLAKVPELVNGLKNKFMSLLSGFKDVGKNIVDGIWNGISAGWDWLTGKVSNLANSLLDAAKSALGIHSPSKEFAKIGEFCVAGFNEGISDLMNTGAITRNINASLSSIGSGLSAGSAGVALGTTTTYNQTINVNQQISTPDELARAIRLESKYGLMRGVPVG